MMNQKWVKLVLFSVGAIVVFTAFFYLYDAAIFEAEIKEGARVVYQTDIALKGFFDYKALPEGVIPDFVASVKPTLKGWLLLLICLVGVPIMIGYRVATTKSPNQKQ